ncbi:MAG: hypothetical protein NDF54_08835 [archaeon GB-1867-035]|nr:hypothetical protein [Candidatus Culexmicrobium profundum]
MISYRRIFLIIVISSLLVFGSFIFEALNPRIEVYYEFYEGDEVLLVNSGFERGLIGWSSNGIIIEGDSFEGSKALLIRNYGSVKANLLKPCPAKGFKVLFAYKVVNLTADGYLCILWIHLTTKIGIQNFNISLGYVTGSTMMQPEFAVTRDNGWASPSTGVEYEVCNGWKIIELNLDRAFEVASRNAIARSKLGIGYRPEFKIENFNVTAIEISIKPVSIEGPKEGCFLIDSITTYSPEIDQNKIIIKLSSKNIVPFTIIISSKGGINCLNLMPFQQAEITLTVEQEPKELIVYIKAPLLPITHIKKIKLH